MKYNTYYSNKKGKKGTNKLLNKIRRSILWYKSLGKNGKLRFTIVVLGVACMITTSILTYQCIKIGSLKNEITKKEELINNKLSKDQPIVESTSDEEDLPYDYITPVVEKTIYETKKDVINNIDAPIGNLSTHNAVKLTAGILAYTGIEYHPASNGKDHPELTKSVKRQLLKDIEREYGRGPISIFNPLDVTQVSGASVEDFEYVLPDELKEIAPALKEVEVEYGINGFFIAAIACLESANGTSKLATEKNNLTGYSANDEYEGTASFGSRFETKSDSIIATAKLISKNYVSEDGKWYNGKSIFDINLSYCSVATWSGKNINRVANFQRDLMEKYNN